MIAGVNDWQKAFEKAGFKNAIMAKEWPENDSTMSMEDARYSVIRYLASPIEMHMDLRCMIHVLGKFWRAIFVGIIM